MDSNVLATLVFHYDNGHPFLNILTPDDTLCSRFDGIRASNMVMSFWCEKWEWGHDMTFHVLDHGVTVSIAKLGEMLLADDKPLVYAYEDGESTKAPRSWFDGRDLFLCNGENATDIKLKRLSVLKLMGEDEYAAQSANCLSDSAVCYLYNNFKEKGYINCD